MNAQLYKSAIEALKASLAEHTVGWANREGHAEAIRCIAGIKAAAGEEIGDDGYFLGVIQELSRLVGELYSPRKHSKYREGLRSGVDVLQSKIGRRLARLERIPALRSHFEGLEDVS